MKTITLFMFLLCATIPVWSDSTGVLNAEGGLDVEKVKALYFNADFDNLITELENYRKSQPEASTDDKIIWNKYLGVVYASKPDTEKKGEAFIYQWISLDPNPQIADLFVSEKIREIFEQQKQDYETVQKSSNKSTSTSSIAASSNSNDLSNSSSMVKPSDNGKNQEQSSSADKNKSWVWWTAGAGAVVAVATTFLLTSGGDPEPETSKSAEVTISWPVPQ